MVLKRIIDILSSFLGIIILWWLILCIWLIATIETKSNGFFLQKRVGRNGKLFILIKIKTMIPIPNINTKITTSNDKRITRWGKLFRKTKLDELPTLWNVLKGDMSLVGPRPDVPGYADKLEGNNKRILNIRPGITGPATIKYANEEKLLSNIRNPEKYNDEVIFLDKVKINLDYLDNWSFWLDIKIIFKTIFRSNY